MNGVFNRLIRRLKGLPFKGPYTKKVFYPREIILEVTNFCNLRCRFCHFHGEGVALKRPKGYMPTELWRKVLKELATWDPTHPITLCLYGAGEPLLYPDLKEVLKEAIKIPHLRVGFMSNAMLLIEDWAKFLVDLPLGWLAFSVDGVEPQINDQIRRGARLEIVERNIERLISYKLQKNSPYPEITFNMVAYPQVSQENIANFVSKWGPFATQVMVSRFRPIPSKRILTEEERKKIQKQPCPLPFRQMVIAWDGRVGLCCEDIFLEVPLGNVYQESLLNVFNNKNFCTIRKYLENCHFQAINLCRDCEIWASEIVLDKKKEKINGLLFEIIKRPAGELYIYQS